MIARSAATKIVVITPELEDGRQGEARQHPADLLFGDTHDGPDHDHDERDREHHAKDLAIGGKQRGSDEDPSEGE